MCSVLEMLGALPAPMSRLSSLHPAKGDPKASSYTPLNPGTPPTLSCKALPVPSWYRPASLLPLAMISSSSGRSPTYSYIGFLSFYDEG